MKVAPSLVKILMDNSVSGIMVSKGWFLKLWVRVHGRSRVRIGVPILITDTARFKVSVRVKVDV